MHIKTKYINAVHNAIDFISSNVDVANEENQEKETLAALNEMFIAMRNSQHDRRVQYYLRKLKNKKQ